MKKVYLSLVLFTLAFAAIEFYLRKAHDLKADQLITISGYYAVLLTTILIFFQLRSGLEFQKRKAAMDFLIGPVTAVLQFKEVELKRLLGKPFLMFHQNESLKKLLSSQDHDEATKEAIRDYALEILNFYERWSMIALKEVLDPDLCYDDKGLMGVSFFRWTEGFINDVRSEHHNERIFENFQIMVINWEMRRNCEVAKRQRRERLNLAKEEKDRKRALATSGVAKKKLI